MSKSTSLDVEEPGNGADKPIDSGMSRLILMDGPAIARLMSTS